MQVVLSQPGVADVSVGPGESDRITFFQLSIAPSPIPGATNTCYQALILTRRPQGGWLLARQKSKKLIATYLELGTNVN